MSTDSATSLDRLSMQWRTAFDAAREALRINSSGPTPALTDPDARVRTARLAQERAEVERLLDATAREERVQLVHRLSAARATCASLGLRPATRACVFDLEGVLAGSAAVHAAAWRDTFDELLSRRVERLGERFAPFAPFRRHVDYELYLHGKPRLDGVRAFLASRGIRLPEGRPDDPPGAETVHGLANRKNEAFLRRLDRQGVSAFDGARLYLEEAAQAGLARAVVSASANTGRVLDRAELSQLIDACAGSIPAACAELGVEPGASALFVMRPADVAAGRAAGFDQVVGVDRAGHAKRLLAAGADAVVTDLTELIAA